MRSLFIGALISALSNILFAWLALVTADVKILAFVITDDNVASGFAGATFIVYLSALTSIKFTATQYALFSSAMLFLPKLIAGYAGGLSPKLTLETPRVVKQPGISALIRAIASMVYLASSRSASSPVESGNVKASKIRSLAFKP